MTFAFRIGRTSVRVHAWFLLAAVGIGLVTKRSAVEVALWVGCLLATVVAHELAHAVVAHLCGSEWEIDVVPLGASRNWARTLARSWRTTAAVGIVGPLVSMTIGALLLLVLRAPMPSGAGRLLRQLGWLSVGWGIVHCLPILPFDGGYVMRALFDRDTNGRGERPAHVASMAAALAFAILATCVRGPIPGFLFVFLAFQNMRAAVLDVASPQEALLRVRLLAGFAAMERGEARTAIDAAAAVLRESVDPRVRSDATRLLAFGHLTQGEWRKLIDVLEHAEPGMIPEAELAKFERAARELDHPDEARCIEALRARTPRRRSATDIDAPRRL